MVSIGINLKEKWYCFMKPGLNENRWRKQFFTFVSNAIQQMLSLQILNIFSIL